MKIFKLVVDEQIHRLVKVEAAKKGQTMFEWLMGAISDKLLAAQKGK